MKPSLIRSRKWISDSGYRDLSRQSYVTHENTDGQTMLEQATLVNLYTDDSGHAAGAGV